MFSDTYRTIASISEGLYKEKGSKFISYAIPVSSEEKAKEYLARIKKEHHDARHHCYAYILGHRKSAFRINDDGEPSGTAGKPIHGQLLSKDLTNVLIIVVRYFGGTKLGVSGLITAYKEAAKNALENAQIIEKTVNDIYRVEFEYPLLNNVMRVLKEEDIELFNQKFEMDCSLDILIRTSLSGRICDIFNKMQGISIRYLGNG